MHWIYVLPSDAPDRFSTFASAMQTDAEAIDAWWRREDPTRVPRNDLTQLSCGAQLDLTRLRLPQSSAQLRRSGRPLRDALRRASRRQLQVAVHEVHRLLRRPRRARPDICGQGASSSSGIGVAVVYVQACAGRLDGGRGRARVPAHARRRIAQRAAQLPRAERRAHLRRRRPTSCTRSWTGLRSTRRLLDPGPRRLLRACRQLLRLPGRSLARAARSSAAVRGRRSPARAA